MFLNFHVITGACPTSPWYRTPSGFSRDNVTNWAKTAGRVSGHCSEGVMLLNCHGTPVHTGDRCLQRAVAAEIPKIPLRTVVPGKTGTTCTWDHTEGLANAFFE